MCHRVWVMLASACPELGTAQPRLSTFLLEGVIVVSEILQVFFNKLGDHPCPPVGRGVPQKFLELTEMAKKLV